MTINISENEAAILRRIAEGERLEDEKEKAFAKLTAWERLKWSAGLTALCLIVTVFFFFMCRLIGGSLHHFVGDLVNIAAVWVLATAFGFLVISVFASYCKYKWPQN